MNDMAIGIALGLLAWIAIDQARRIDSLREDIDLLAAGNIALLEAKRDLKGM